MFVTVIYTGIAWTKVFEVNLFFWGWNTRFICSRIVYLFFYLKLNFWCSLIFQWLFSWTSSCKSGSLYVFHVIIFRLLKSYQTYWIFSYISMRYLRQKHEEQKGRIGSYASFHCKLCDKIISCILLSFSHLQSLVSQTPVWHCYDVLLFASKCFCLPEIL